ncbi:MAG TPA: hypothetical protein VEB40_00895 [Flavipsychrobacter sp.]|nr:hypothetical protein [Flavipsychrobacter sp.]
MWKDNIREYSNSLQWLQDQCDRKTKNLEEYSRKEKANPEYIRREKAFIAALEKCVKEINRRFDFLNQELNKAHRANRKEFYYAKIYGLILEMHGLTHYQFLSTQLIEVMHHQWKSLNKKYDKKNG